MSQITACECDLEDDMVVGMLMKLVLMRVALVSTSRLLLLAGRSICSRCHP
jgi:hypothetical protein